MLCANIMKKMKIIIVANMVVVSIITVINNKYISKRALPKYTAIKVK